MSHRLTIPQVSRAIASLGEHGGSRYIDIRKALKENGGEKPSLVQLKATLARACKMGAVCQASQGRWKLQENFRWVWGRAPGASSSHLHRRRRRRRGDKGKGKGKRKGRRKGRRRRRRRRKRSRSKGRGKKGKGKKGKKGKKGRK
ncbi:hypothetical protein ACOMHN_043849 [Nucella lapillus]